MTAKKNQLPDSISVAEATRRVVKTRPSILDCLKYEIVNYTSLAHFIKNEVLEVCKKDKIKLDSIKISLMRYSDELKKDEEIREQKIRRILCDSVLELKNDLAVLTVKQNAVIKAASMIFDFIGKFRFFQMIQGTEVFTLLVDSNKRGEFMKILPNDAITNIADNQSAIILISPPEIINTAGVISYLTSLLAARDINITQVMSCHTDTIFIVERGDALAAYEILEEKIYFLRGLKSLKQPKRFHG